MIRDPLPGSGQPRLDPEEGADILVVIAQHLLELAPALGEQVVAQLIADVRAAYGGQRVRIPKRGKHLSEEERVALFQDGLSNMPTEEILRKHKISLRTLEREMKRGGRFG